MLIEREDRQEFFRHFMNGLSFFQPSLARLTTRRLALNVAQAWAKLAKAR